VEGVQVYVNPGGRPEKEVIDIETMVTFTGMGPSIVVVSGGTTICIT
jgi:hypothetical protein